MGAFGTSMPADNNSSCYFMRAEEARRIKSEVPDPYGAQEEAMVFPNNPANSKNYSPREPVPRADYWKFLYFRNHSPLSL